MSPRVIYAPVAERTSRRYGWGVVNGREKVKLQPQEAGVLLAVMFAPPVKYREIIEALWGDDEDGGPLCAENAVRVYVWKLNKKLRPLGWQVRGRHTVGYKLEQT